jgi:CubicO group peptidase (beta-lactamase class C family)
MRKWFFWGTTALFSLGMLASSLMYLTQAAPLQAGFAHLGFPLYLLPFLGIAKLLGALALLVRRFPTLTEWAYAGFTFNLLGAAWAHLMSGDPVAQVISPLVFLALLAASYALSKVSPQPQVNLQTRTV